MPATLAALTGAALTALLVDLDVVGFHWLPALLGATLVGVAVVGRTGGPLWGPGLVLLGVGVVVGVWFEGGRSADDYRLVPWVALGLGAGATTAALLARAGAFTVDPLSLALPVLAFGGLALADQLGPGPLAQTAWPYALGVAVLAVLSARGARR